MQLVIHPPVEAARLSRIVESAAPMRVTNAADPAEALAAMPAADAFFGKLTPELLEAAGRLRWVQSPTASLEHYLFPALVEHDCTLTNMRGLYSDVIAEHVLGLMLCFTRHLHTYVRNQARRRWAPVGGEETRATFATGPGALTEMDRAHRSLADVTLGIVGLGEIGSQIARSAAGFGTRVRAVDPVRATPSEGVEEVWPVARLNDLLRTSDFVVIAAPHTPQTERMFGRERFRAMRREGVLINIGRGAIVVLDELVEALRRREIAGAALDVFEIEPLPEAHPLWSFDNVILTPHVAGQSPRIAERHLQVVLENVRRFVRGEPLVNVADKRRWF